MVVYGYCFSELSVHMKNPIVNNDSIWENKSSYFMYEQHNEHFHSLQYIVLLISCDDCWVPHREEEWRTDCFLMLIEKCLTRLYIPMQMKLDFFEQSKRSESRYAGIGTHAEGLPSERMGLPRD